MGDDVEARTFTRADRTRYRQKVRHSLDVFARMLREARFDTSRQTIGCEIELNLVDERGDPAMRNEEVLAAIANPDFQTELGQFNVEINMPPRPLSGTSLAEFEDQVRTVLNDAEQAARGIGAHLMMIGILPTLQPDHLDLNTLTANPRYRLLNEQIFAARGEDMPLAIDGPERLRATAESIAPESACTSVQLHLQVAPGVVRRLLERGTGDRGGAGGRRGELAVPVRQGAVARDPDRRCSTRPPTPARTSSRSRACGRGCGSASAGSPRSSTCSRRTCATSPRCCRSATTRTRRWCSTAATPRRCRELRLHNGTVYRWNRPVYDVVGGEPHLRVENRVLPAGPTVVDTAGERRVLLRPGAGARRGRAAAVVADVVRRGRGELPRRRQARHRRACCSGRVRARCPAAELVLRRLLPMADEGLERWGVDPARARPAARHHRGAVPHRAERGGVAGRDRARSCRRSGTWPGRRAAR